MHINFNAYSAQYAKYHYQIFYVLFKAILSLYEYIINICFYAFDVTEYLIYFGLEYISQSAHVHREAIISEFTKFSYDHRHVLASGGKPYSVLSHV